jgi:DNA-binding transcriptional MerR regulator
LDDKSEREKSEEHISIGELSEIVNLNPSTIRYYEELGMIDTQRKHASGHRRYGREEIVKLNLINRAKSLGMSLDEIKELIDLFGIDAREKKGIQRALEILDDHMVEIDERIKELRVLRNSMKQEKQRLQNMLD